MPLVPVDLPSARPRALPSQTGVEWPLSTHRMLLEGVRVDLAFVEGLGMRPIDVTPVRPDGRLAANCFAGAVRCAVHRGVDAAGRMPAVAP